MATVNQLDRFLKAWEQLATQVNHTMPALAYRARIVKANATSASSGKKHA